jgi:formylmethanofuran dehydrogenase subunit C
MSDVVVLTFRGFADGPIEVDGLTADRFAALNEQEIAALPVWAGSRRLRLGDLFAVKGGRAADVRVEGDLGNVDGIAAGMSGGQMIVEGHVGSRLAAEMRGGWVDVRGDAGDDAGVGMAGGALRITGNAGNRVGAGGAGASKGMSGGEIIVSGSAGGEVAARLRRGLVVVGGDVAADPARAVVAGTLMVFGRTGPRAGRGSKRGSIVAIGGIDIPATYTYACTYQPPHVRFTLTYLRRRYGLSIDDEALNGRYHRHCGDAGDVGKGEILELVRG